MPNLGVAEEQPMHESSICLKCSNQFFYQPCIDSFEYCQGCLSTWWEKYSGDRVAAEILRDERDEMQEERDELQKRLDDSEVEADGLKRRLEELMQLDNVIEKLGRIRVIVEAIPAPPAPKQELSTEETRVIVRKQIAQARKGKVTCECGVVAPLWLMYRCLYCGRYWCKSCAGKHFEKGGAS